MLDIKFLRNDPESVRRALQNRGGRYVPALEDLLAADAEWKAANGESEPLRARRNQAADEMGRLKREKKDATALLKEMEELKTRLKGLDEKTAAAQARVDEKVLGLPNLPHPSVPVGADAGQNREIRRWGEPKKFPFKPRDHQDIGEKLGVLDMARAAKLSGARFALLSGAGAKMERALIHFMLDLHTGVHGYTEIFPPFLVTRQTMTGTGQLPKFADELYATKDDDLFLIPTAEVPLTNLYRDEPLDEATLPRALCAYTACFRREAGSYGKDTRGLIRNHQFNKIELVRFVRPEDSLAELEKLTGHAEEVLKRLGLPYRVMELCTGDLGFSSAKTYDLEVWLPAENGGQGAYREISSCSTFTDFQARRIGLRYKKSDGSRALMHTLNGSGVAVGRTLAAVLENYQDADGSVAVPEALRTLMGIDRLSPP
ncbi:MAG TPA: serine--tRNA ligase [Elusimicrobiota bacterium]|jgi:seryl-tRNA synthetase|nr:serine--tRNA ligase [Elusimicrobiota bacterium]HMZ26273.1 serine--tRNA ligase [Elusimicrobiota bacterium]HNA59517.1 serine--tRNA ligase [Elusimicrobiota bacterium]HND63256.1 serine--tRNA ligase [Elusimicrobiota bacterium]HNG44160.1 serine--tRNA ligase [Elusimicrobiota bacterium]